MKIFVTGGSGFVGGHVIERLCDEHEIVAMARSDRSAGAVETLGATAVRCSLGHVRPEHLEGVDVIVHSAAFVEEWGTREQFFQVNVEGTRQLLDVAKRAGVSRFIHIGTEAALFDGSDLVEATEETPYPDHHRFLYSESKAAAERLVLGANTSGFTTLSLRPRLVWGPRDATVLPAIKEMVERNAFVWLDGGDSRTSTTHVANLVHAVRLALTEGRGGEAYFVADGEDSRIRDFLIRLAATDDVELPDRSIPGWLARSLAAATEGVWRLLRLRSTPPLTLFSVAMMSREVTVRTEKAQRELGYQPVMTLERGFSALRAS
jgi:nucleoside-diphosphate-sugar epimerase